jgi:hypothetical protein
MIAWTLEEYLDPTLAFLGRQQKIHDFELEHGFKPEVIVRLTFSEGFRFDNHAFHLLYRGLRGDVICERSNDRRPYQVYFKSFIDYLTVHLVA